VRCDALIGRAVFVFQAGKGNSIDQLNKDTGNRIKNRKVDAETGEEV
jgi:non-homologous end joining protein Ku